MEALAGWEYYRAFMLPSGDPFKKLCLKALRQYNPYIQDFLTISNILKEQVEQPILVIAMNSLTMKDLFKNLFASNAATGSLVTITNGPTFQKEMISFEKTKKYNAC